MAEKQREAARNPEDLARLFIVRANAGDVEGLASLYEPGAVLACPNGHLAVGIDAIRRFYSRLLADRPVFLAGEQSPPLRNGNVALTSSRLKNGAVTAEIARQQLDGTWLWAVDQPSVSR